MALLFTCRECGLEIVTRFLQRGEVANCPHCRKSTPVPENATGIEAPPTISPIGLKSRKAAEEKLVTGAPRSDFPGIPGIFALLGMMVLFLVVLGIPTMIVINALDLSEEDMTGAILVVSQIAILLTTLWGWRRTRLPFREIFPLRGFPPRLIGPLLLTILGVMIIEMKIIGLLFRIHPPSESMLTMLNSPITGNYWFFFAFGVVMAPLSEEMLYRGVMLRGLKRRHGTGVAIILSALTFALCHPPHYTMIPIILVGALLGWWFVTTGSLLPPILGHAFNNLVSDWWGVIVLGEDLRGKEDFLLTATFTGPSPWVSVCGLLMLAVGIYWRYNIGDDRCR